MRTLIVLIIVLGNFAATPFVNRIHPTVWGMPFFLWWFLIWMIITPLLTWVIYAMDNRAVK